jgi:hypothetical protein
MKKSIFILSIFALLNSCSKTEKIVIPTSTWPADYYIEAKAICNDNSTQITTYNTNPNNVGYVQFGWVDSFTPAANKWYKTNIKHISYGNKDFVPVYIKIGSNNRPVPSNSKIPGIGSYSVYEFKEYNSPCQ